MSQKPDLHALYMATLTLTRMAEGGLYDQLGGGFARYSVDEFWMIPHFEKMLYDNGALLASYAEAALATGEPLFRRIARETGEWLLREMQDRRSGGFYSAYDADSEGHEGKFYVWTREEVQSALTSLEWSVFSRRFGFDQDANFEGAWHCHAFVSLEQIAKEQQLEPELVQNELDSARARLLAIRSKRVWPGLDDKILTSWNALAIRGLAIAARGLGEKRFAAAADRALDFVRRELWKDGRLLATSKGGVSHLNAYLDDYAYLAHALLDMLQLRWRNEDVAWLREILGVMLARFEDAELGGFFFTSDDHEQLIHRSKSFSDDAIPAGNGIAARALIRAGYLLGETRWLEAAERTLRAAWLALNRFPHGHMSLLEALAEYLTPPEIVIIRGAESDRWRDELVKLYSPHRLVFSIPAELAGARRGLGRQAGRCRHARVCLSRLDLFGAGGIAGGSGAHGAGAHRLSDLCGISSSISGETAGIAGASILREPDGIPSGLTFREPAGIPREPMLREPDGTPREPTLRGPVGTPREPTLRGPDGTPREPTLRGPVGTPREPMLREPASISSWSCSAEPVPFSSPASSAAALCSLAPSWQPSWQPFWRATPAPRLPTGAPMPGASPDLR